MMKFVSWNVNGLRAAVNKGFPELFDAFDADFVCLQETKLQQGQIDLEFDGYTSYWSYADRKGYSGTVIYSRHKPLSVRTGLGIDRHDHEGRVVALEFEKFYLVCIYSPNSQELLARIDYRTDWEASLKDFLVALDKDKPVVVCGDLNVAHQDIDLAHPNENRGSAGFSDQERECFGALLASGFTDTYRYLYPDKTGAYSWWSYRYGARRKNIGWRIDYFLVSDRLAPAISDATIMPHITGSDHCPVTLTLNI